MLSVRMLGVLSMSVDGRRVGDDLGPSGRSLSGYLFEFVGRVHRRERLAEQFWGHLDPERARAALNTALWRLRKLLACDPSSDGGSNLRTSGSDVVLAPAAWLDVDTLRFDLAMKHLLHQHNGNGGESGLEALENAVETYTGPFLDGEDADWILEERERLHSLYIRAVTELVRSYARIERYEEAIAAARRILTADPFRESVHRDLLILLVLNGQRAEALRHHDRWCALFRDELAISPVPDTLRLAEDIRSGLIFDKLDGLTAKRFSQVQAKPSAESPNPGATTDGSSILPHAPDLVPQASEARARH